MQNRGDEVMSWVFMRKNSDSNILMLSLSDCSTFEVRD
jgi:hypothetical protein